MKKYAFLMVDYQLPEAIQELQRQINPADLYVVENSRSGFTYGMEMEPHVTVAPCLRNNVKLDNLKPFLHSLEEYRLELTNLNVFENKLFDVLVCDVKKCEVLHSTNAEIADKYKLNTSFDDFNSHITVAYLKKGKGGEYAKLKFPESVTMKPKCFAFSHYEGEKRTRIEFSK